MGLAATPGVAVHSDPQTVQLAGVQLLGFEKSVASTPVLLSQVTVPDEFRVQDRTVSANDPFVPSYVNTQVTPLVEKLVAAPLHVTFVAL